MTANPCAEILGVDERDILQEIMNIGFGSAAADLAGVIDLHVQLSVPQVRLLPASELPGYIDREVPDPGEITIIEQNFWSRFKGTALLVFPSGAGKALLGFLGEVGEHAFESDPLRILEKETLMEVGNILVGACVGKVAELLGDIVTYSPPRVLSGSLDDAALTRKVSDPGNHVIVLRTAFHFGNRDVQGHLFLVARHESVTWLRRALQGFMSRYA
ncbi:MAG: chemotaxis protein CheC [Thermodesulfobacteriota bacterium]